MPWETKAMGGKHQVVKKGDGKVVGTHGTHVDAARQLRALYANVKEPDDPGKAVTYKRPAKEAQKKRETKGQV